MPCSDPEDPSPQLQLRDHVQLQRKHISLATLAARHLFAYRLCVQHSVGASASLCFLLRPGRTWGGGLPIARDLGDSVLSWQGWVKDQILVLLFCCRVTVLPLPGCCGHQCWAECCRAQSEGSVKLLSLHSCGPALSWGRGLTAWGEKVEIHLNLRYWLNENVCISRQGNPECSWAGPDHICSQKTRTVLYERCSR